jgi:uncharacterized delta-60 repeat protein
MHLFLRRKSFAKFILGFALFSATESTCFSQTPGSVDTSFTAGLQEKDSIRSIVSHGNGQVSVAGRRTEMTYDEEGNLMLTVSGLVARLGPQGALDPEFKSGARATDPSAATSLVTAMVAQPDGALLLGGSFTMLDEVARPYLARLESQGTLDAAFHPVANKKVEALSIHTDGRIVAAGSFTSFGGATRKYVAQVNPDGSIDSSFTTEAGGPDTTVWAVAALPDNRVWIGGDFITVDGVARGRIARLKANGTVDPSFDPGIGANDSVYALLPLPDGKLVIAGVFTSYNGVKAGPVARLNANGSLDTEFDAGPSSGGRVYALARQADGKILVGGSFTLFNGRAAGRIARLLPNGAFDESFNTGTGANDQVRNFAVQLDGRILVGGHFSDFGGQTVAGLVRLYADAVSAEKPVVTDQPKSQTIALGSSAVFEVKAKGTAPLEYQWQHDGTTILFGTNATLTLPSAQAADAGEYRVRVSNSAGSVTSEAALLTFVSQPALALTWSDEKLVLGLSGIAGKTYRVDYADRLEEPVLWNVLTNVILTSGASQSLEIPAEASVSERYFRVSETQ